MEALTKVLSLPAVHSKRFLTTKVDRCVTGQPHHQSPHSVAAAAPAACSPLYLVCAFIAAIRRVYCLGLQQAMQAHDKGMWAAWYRLCCHSSYVSPQLLPAFCFGNM